MTIQNINDIKGSSTEYRDILDKVYVEGDNPLGELFEEAPVNGTRVSLQLVEAFPRAEKWKGSMIHRPLIAQELEAKIEPYAAGTTIDRVEWEAEESLAAQSLAKWLRSRDASNFVAQQMSQLIEDGFTENGYDNVSFYNDSHGNGGANSYDNRETAALTRSQCVSSMNAMMLYKDKYGRPRNVRPNILHVPPALRQTAEDIANNSRRVESSGDGAIDNLLTTDLKVVVDVETSSTTKWYLHDTRDASNRPFIMAHDGKGIVPEDNTNSYPSEPFYKFRLVWSGLFTYGHPYKSLGSLGTG